MEKKVEELRHLRREIKKLQAEEKALANDIRIALQCGLSVPGARLSAVTAQDKWAAHALATALEIAPKQLTKPALVPVKDLTAEQLEECKTHGIIETATPQPNVILDKRTPLDN